MIERGCSSSCDFYDIPEQPFGESPDPRYLYASAMHSQAVFCLVERFERGDCLQVLIAPPGSGKTTILHLLLDRVRGLADSAFIFYTHGGAEDLIGFINWELGIPNPSRALADRREALQSFLSARDNGRRPVLVVIDEAQNLDESALAALDRLLSDNPRRLQMILSGQTETATSMSRALLGSLGHRVTAWHELRPLDLEEVVRYIRHRLRVAGYSGPELFTPEALELIAKETSGIPRNINTLCYYALHYGWVRRKSQIDEGVVRHALERCAFTESATKMLSGASAVPAAKPKENASSTEAGTLAKVLREWISAGSGVWSGTAWELHEQLRSVSARQDVPALSAGELEQLIRSKATALLESGVEVELQSKPGSPRRISVRLVGNGLHRRTA